MPSPTVVKFLTCWRRLHNDSLLWVESNIQQVDVHIQGGVCTVLGSYNCANDEEYETVLPRTKVDDSLLGDQREPALDGKLSPVIWGG